MDEAPDPCAHPADVECTGKVSLTMRTLALTEDDAP